MDVERCERATIEAELATGAREASDEAAKRHVFIRVARVFVGFTILIAGVAMLPLPGPGGLVIAAGLVILAEDIAWADRALRIVRQRMPGVPEDGKISRSTMLVGTLLAAAGAVPSRWLALR